MDAKLEQLEATLNNINVFNAGKMLAQLLPEVESFQAETQRLRDTIAHERRNASFQREINADLRNELKAERSHSFDQSIEYSARDCAPQPLKLSIHSGGIEHPCRCR